MKSQLFEEKGLIKISVMYPFSEGNTFNIEYYETKHMPMVAGFLGANLVKYTIEKGVASGIPNQPLPYMAIGTFYVKNLAEIPGSNYSESRCDKSRLRELYECCSGGICQ